MDRVHFFGKNISIHAPREGGDAIRNKKLEGKKMISIHAPREGGDAVRSWETRWKDISIHAPREGGDRGYCHRVADH